MNALSSKAAVQKVAYKAEEDLSAIRCALIRAISMAQLLSESGGVNRQAQDGFTILCDLLEPILRKAETREEHFHALKDACRPADERKFASASELDQAVALAATFGDQQP
jgi:CII-binding regulator of phage lambda lysogenization HflD